MNPADDGAVVLVVDDSAETLGMVSQILEPEGLRVLIALDGNQALKIARKMQPDIVLLDALMPSVDGFDTCRALKKEAPLSNTPIIFMTGLSETEYVVRGLEAGGVDYITKPIVARELIARIRVHLGNARMSQSAREALDTAGQNIFTTDQDGNIRWATPRAYAQFESCGVNSRWLEIELPRLLRQWLSHSPASPSQLILATPGDPLTCKFLGQTQLGHYLFRLIATDETDNLELLKAMFSLTEREAEVLLWLSCGKTNREIAQILNMSPRTVNKHLEPVFRKMCVENRTAAAAAVIRLFMDGGHLN
ncbi:MAG TPA: DNA-binding response regulator [Porticoccaceae bacterium]|nr:DNA-binding response regulator [Porticoccaceae bacterium]